MNILTRGVLCILAVSPAYAASFDCTQATSYPEKTVCADSELSSLDESLAKIYGETLREKSGIQADQRKWLRLRNTCVDRACLVAAYQQRIIKLSGLEREATEICTQVEKLARKEGGRSLWLKNDEEALGELCGYTVKSGEIKCEYFKHPFDFTKLRAMGVDPSEEKALAEYIDGGWRIAVSLVDINNDGFQDMHFRTWQGTLSCEKNTYLFGTEGSKFRKSAGSVIAEYMSGEDAGFCSGDGSVTLKNGAATYSVHLRPASPKLGAVFRGMPDGSFLKLCQLSGSPR